jgi:type IV secretory pathway VirB9-like protein
MGDLSTIAGGSSAWAKELELSAGEKIRTVLKNHMANPAAFIEFSALE